MGAWCPISSNCQRCYTKRTCSIRLLTTWCMFSFVFSVCISVRPWQSSKVLPDRNTLRNVFTYCFQVAILHMYAFILEAFVLWSMLLPPLQLLLSHVLNLFLVLALNVYRPLFNYSDGARIARMGSQYSSPMRGGLPLNGNTTVLRFKGVLLFIHH